MKPVIRPSSVGTPRYGTVRGEQPLIPLGKSPESPAGDIPTDREHSADDGPADLIPDDPGLGEGI
ncbi:MAG TPA: hypothetical protein VF371_05010 [Candidatus Limnocylindrales bacterium]